MSTMTRNVDNSVAERRLRPIYDWLDSGNNKKALQECDKVLKKSPNLQCARALKALTLHRMGKDADSVQILDDLTLAKPTDDPTLQAMTLCCREMKKLDRICKLYENAAKLDPSNEEIQTQLFMSFVRIGDFKQQQMVAMTLYKHKLKNPYYCWAVMSVILQATRGDGLSDPKKRSLLLSLAERMMEKLISENKLEAEQEVQLYIIVLEQQKKFMEINKLLDGPMHEKLQCTSLPEMRLKYHKLLKQWNFVNILCKNILLENMDRWDIWIDYIDSVFGLTNCQDLDLEHDSSPEQAHEFICRIIESVGSRGPYLARFQLCLRMQQQGTPFTDLLGDLISLFVEYFRKFACKPCCVSDLRQFLCLLTPEQKLELVKLLETEVQDKDKDQSLPEMQRHICFMQLSRLCGAHRNLDVAAQRLLVAEMCRCYTTGYELHGKNLLTTDLGPSDPYIQMAVHLLSDMAHDYNDSQYLVAAIGLIHMLLKNSPSNFHAKLLGVRLNHLIGNLFGAQDLYNSLDIKHLQLDSMGYVKCVRLPVSGHFSACSVLFEATTYFFSSNYKDSSDHLTFSYKFGSFIKLDEFMDFRERLRLSFHYAHVDLDRLFLQIIEQTDIGAKLTPQSEDLMDNLGKLRNNYDFNVNVSWDPERIHGSPDTEDFFHNAQQFLNTRAQLVVCLNSAIDAANAEEADRDKKMSELKQALLKWTGLEGSLQCREESTRFLNRPLPSRLGAYTKVPFFSVLSKLFGLFEDSKASHDLNADLQKLDNLFSAYKLENLMERREALEIIVNCTELISIAALVCGLLIEQNRRHLSTTKKGKKRPQCADSIKSAVQMVADCAQRLLTNADKWAEQLAECCVVEALQELSFCDTKPVQTAIAASYSDAAKEVRTVLKNKVKYLTALV